MQSDISTTTSVRALTARLPALDAHVLRTSLLLTGVFTSAWLSLAVVDTESLVPSIWPAGAFTAGLYLTSPKRLRPRLLASCFGLMLLAHLLAGYDWRVALGFTASSIAASWLVRPLLVRGLDGRRAALLDQGDVSRLIGAIALSSLVAGAGCGLTAWATGNGSPWLGSLGAFGATAAALMILLPLFLETLRFEPLASSRERIIQGVLTLGTTTAVFASTNVPLVIFAVMPSSRGTRSAARCARPPSC